MPSRSLCLSCLIGAWLSCSGPSFAQSQDLDVVWRIEVLRHGVVQAIYQSAGFCANLGADSVCGNQLFNLEDGDDPTRRDVGFLERLCGSNPFAVIVEPADEGLKTVTCGHNGPWEISVIAKLQDAFGNAKGEDFPVTVEFELTPPQQ
jgi:hypothetical protein